MADEEASVVADVDVPEETGKDGIVWTPETIRKELAQLGKDLGPTFICVVLSVIDSAVEGITKRELADICSLHEGALCDVFSRMDEMPEQRRMPSDYLETLLKRASAWLEVPEEENVEHRIRWKMQDVSQIVKQTYLVDLDTFTDIHSVMAEYFLGKWGETSKPFLNSDVVVKKFSVSESGTAMRGVLNQPTIISDEKRDAKLVNGKRFNMRKMKELPTHLMAACMWKDMTRFCLTNLEFLHAAVCVETFDALMADYESLPERIQEPIAPFISALRADLETIKSDPDQICSQLAARHLQLYGKRQPTAGLMAETFETCRQQGKVSAMGLWPMHACIPFRSCHSIAQIRRHDFGVYGISVAKQVDVFATASDDKLIKVWQPTRIKPLQLCNTSDEWLRSVALTPSGDRAIVGGYDSRVIQIDVVTGELLARFEDHTGCVNAVGFSPDGTLAVSGSEDCTAIVWNLVEKQKQALLDGHTGAVVGAAFVDARRVLTASADKSAMVFDASSGALLSTITGHLGPLTALCVFSNAAQFATGSDDKTIRVFEVPPRSVREVRTSNTILEGHTDSITAIQHVRSGSTLLVSASLDRTVRLWDLEQNSQLCCFTADSGVRCVGVIPKRQLVVYGSETGVVGLLHMSSTPEEILALSPFTSDDGVDREFKTEQPLLNIQHNGLNSIRQSLISTGSGSLFGFDASMSSGRASPTSRMSVSSPAFGFSQGLQAEIEEEEAMTEGLTEKERAILKERGLIKSRPSSTLVSEMTAMSGSQHSLPTPTATSATTPLVKKKPVPEPERKDHRDVDLDAVLNESQVNGLLNDLTPEEKQAAFERMMLGESADVVNYEITMQRDTVLTSSQPLTAGKWRALSPAMSNIAGFDLKEKPHEPVQPKRNGCCSLV
eukprot:m.175140 g.175140  ORF g.175140 m.175140 type:complete len:895 (-) comp14606_c0_seq7:2160-4844(-)